jgi:hypothetical protein
LTVGGAERKGRITAFTGHCWPAATYPGPARIMFLTNQPSVVMAARTSQTMNAAALSQQSLPTIPSGQTTVLTVDELNRIKTTLLHADAKTKGSQILSEVGSSPFPRIFLLVLVAHANDLY